MTCYPHQLSGGMKQRVAIAMGPDKVEVRATLTGKLVLPPLESKLGANVRVGGLALSTDGATVALADGSSNVQVWNLNEAAGPRKFAPRVAQNRTTSTQFLHFSRVSFHPPIRRVLSRRRAKALWRRRAEPAPARRITTTNC